MSIVNDRGTNPSAPKRGGVGRFFKGIETHIQRRTLGGLMELVPLVVTVFIIAFIVNKADDIIRPLPYIAGRPWDFPGIGIAICVIVFYLVGVLISNTIGKKMMSVQDSVMNVIPVVKTVYGVTQKATEAMTSQYGFTRVAFLEWPREGMLAIGFVTGHAFSSAYNRSLAVVYIPTVPNPTSGNLALVNADDLIETDLTVEDAMKLVFSGGIVLPPTFALARAPREEGERTDMDLIGEFKTDTR